MLALIYHGALLLVNLIKLLALHWILVYLVIFVNRIPIDVVVRLKLVHVLVINIYLKLALFALLLVSIPLFIIKKGDNGWRVEVVPVNGVVVKWRFKSLLKYVAECDLPFLVESTSST